MSTSPLITYLALDPNNDVQWNAPLYNQDAVRQAIQTRLNLFAGEWWASLVDGLPVWQSILAQGASPTAQRQMEAIISARILGSPFVISLANVAVTFSPATRAFGYSAQVNTQFGTVAINNFPVPPGVSS